MCLRARCFAPPMELIIPDLHGPCAVGRASCADASFSYCALHGRAKKKQNLLSVLA